MTNHVKNPKWQVFYLHIFIFYNDLDQGQEEAKGQSTLNTARDSTRVENVRR